MQNVNENILSFTAEHPPPQAVEVIGPYKKVSGNPCGNFREKLFLQSWILPSAASSNTPPIHQNSLELMWEQFWSIFEKTIFRRFWSSCPSLREAWLGLNKDSTQGRKIAATQGG